MTAAAAWDTEVPLGRLTTYKVGGRAERLAEASSPDEVARLVMAETGPVTILGKGSNVVVSDRGVAGAVIRLVGGSIEFEGDVVYADAGVALPVLAREATQSGRFGLEFYVGVPGTVGGAVVMNAGCHGGETRHRLLAAEVLDMRSGERSWRSADDLRLGYRHSNLTSADVVLGARFRSAPGDPEAAARELRAITSWRRLHQPGGTFNAGSVFKNPPGDAAGRLIDAAGLKGFRIGGAAVSTKHANFIVAERDARSNDIWRLVWAVRRRVWESHGVRLEPEVRFLGPFLPVADQELA